MERCTLKKRFSFILSCILSLSISTQVFAAAKDMPSIYGKAAITMDADTGEIIYAKSADNKMYPASTTKIMTALLLAEHKDKGDNLTYTESAKIQPEYSLDKNMHPIAVGETMTGADAMDGLLLYSGNDVAYMIADNVAGNAKSFENMMNEEIKKLGLKNTYFVTPNGLHDANHYTTAYDLTVIARAAYKNPWVRESMGKKTSTIRTSAGTVLIIENRNKNLGVDGNVGGKTGYTAPAGRCLVAVYERGGRKLVGVIMNSVYDSQDSYVFQDMKKVIDWSYDAKKTVIYPKGTALKTETITYKPLGFFGPEKKIDVPLIVKEDVTIYENEVNKKDNEKIFKLNKLNPWSLDEDTKLGTLTLKQREASKDYSLYTNVSKGTLLKQNILLYTFALISVIAVLALIAVVIKLISNKKRRKKRPKYY